MSNGFPIHAYGTGQIMSAISDWRDRERQREDEMIKILTNQIATGNIAAITPDVRAKLNKRGISDPMISGLQKQGQQAQFDREMLKATRELNLFNVLETLEEKFPGASESQIFKKASSKIDGYNEYLSAKENRQNTIDKKIGQAIEFVSSLGETKPEELSQERLDQAEKALAVAAKHATGEKYKNLIGMLQKQVEDYRASKIKVTEAKRKEQVNLAEAKRKEGIKTWSNIEADIAIKALEKGYDKLKPFEKRIIEKKLEGTGKTPQEIYEDTRARWKAKIDAFEKAQGRKATTDEKRRLFIPDPWGFLAPAPQESLSSGKKYLQTATNHETGEQVGLTEEGVWETIK